MFFVYVVVVVFFLSNRRTEKGKHASQRTGITWDIKIIPTTVLATSAARKATVGIVQEVFTLFPHKKQHAQETHIFDGFQFDATWRYTTKMKQPAAGFFCMLCEKI